MNRRDIIVVAVLINAGLLVVLFFSSLKTDKKSPVSLSSVVHEQVEAPKVIPKSALSSYQGGDQIDQMIHQYATKPATPELKKEVPTQTALPSLPPIEKKLSPPILPPKNKDTIQNITVEKGDVLEKIAKFYNVTVEEIMNLNHLSNTRLQIGQVLRIPVKEVQKKEIKVEDGKHYIVKGGDTPWTIAQKSGMQVEELLRLNDMDEEKAKRLRPGDRLKIK